jgi:hypothetical protein
VLFDFLRAEELEGVMGYGEVWNQEEGHCDARLVAVVVGTAGTGCMGVGGRETGSSRVQSVRAPTMSAGGGGADVLGIGDRGRGRERWRVQSGSTGASWSCSCSS